MRLYSVLFCVAPSTCLYFPRNVPLDIFEPSSGTDNSSRLHSLPQNALFPTTQETHETAKNIRMMCNSVYTMLSERAQRQRFDLVLFIHKSKPKNYGEIIFNQYFTVKLYRLINSAKFKVINKICRIFAVKLKTHTITSTPSNADSQKTDCGKTGH